MYSFVAWFILVILSAGVLLWLYSRKYSHLPGDLGIPIFGNLWNVITTLAIDEKGIIKRANEILEKHGNLACTWLGPRIVVISGDPHAIEELIAHPGLKYKEALVFDKMDFLTRGSFHMAGDYSSVWKVSRKNMTNSLTKSKLDYYHDTFIRKSLWLVEVLKDHKGEFDIKPLLFQLSISMILETHFGITMEGEDEMFREFHKDMKRLEEILHDAINVPIYKIIPNIYFEYRFSRLKGYHTFISKVIEKLRQKTAEHMGNSEQDSNLPIAAELFLKNTVNNVPMRQTKKELNEFWFSGGDTIYNFLSFLFFCIAMHPDIQERLWKEQEEIFEGSNRMVTSEDLKKMDYLEMALKETSRHIGGPFFPRRIYEEAKIGKYVIPSNSTILIANMGVRKSPMYWEEPNQFYPEHFSPENVLKRPTFAYTSFGISPRNCPGYHYALHSVKVVASRVLRNFKLSSRVKFEDMKLTPVLLYILEGPALISIEPRCT